MTDYETVKLNADTYAKIDKMRKTPWGETTFDGVVSRLASLPRMNAYQAANMLGLLSRVNTAAVANAVEPPTNLNNGDWFYEVGLVAAKVLLLEPEDSQQRIYTHKEFFTNNFGDEIQVVQLPGQKGMTFSCNSVVWSL